MTASTNAQIRAAAGTTSSTEQILGAKARLESGAIYQSDVEVARTEALAGRAPPTKPRTRDPVGSLMQDHQRKETYD